MILCRTFATFLLFCFLPIGGDISCTVKRCEWEPWESWSACTRTCGGGYHFRSRHLCCKAPVHIEECKKDCGVDSSDFDGHGTCNTLCVRGSYHNNRCNCPPEYYGICCEKVCPAIDHCSTVSCTSMSDAVCTSCEDQGGDIQHSVYWPDVTKTHCHATCSWKFHRCWPGKCITSLPDSCLCETGFRKDSVTVSCDITTKADLEFCKMSVEDIHGEIRQTSSSSKFTACSNEVDVYINIKPISLSFKITADFTREGMTTEPDYIQPSSTKIGIVEGTVSLRKEDISGIKSLITETSLNGGGDCKTPLSSTSTSVLLDCNQKITLTTSLSNGQRLCAVVTVSSGGSFKYIDYSKSYRGTHNFTPVTESKMLCFKYDDVPPVHCAATSTCKQEPLSLSARVTRSANITVSISGWVDPHPQHGKPDQASGVDFYKLDVYGVKQLGAHKLTVDYSTSVYESKNLRGSSHNINVTLPDEPAMYATYLEVHDEAGNVRFARRFFLYDNNSTLDVRQDKHLRVVSASNNTNYKWQINHNKISLDWKHRYYNDYYIKNDLLVPIKADTGNSIGGVYEQNTGVLPVTGTENVNGITSFKYQWTLNNGSRTPWTLVPDFTNQSLSLDLNLTDGETYEVWIKAEDIIQNSVVESVVVHIDSSAPVVTAADVNTSSENAIIPEPDVMMSDIELNTGDSIFINAELEDEDLTPTFNFHAYDIHSGISSVGWALRTSEKDSYVRSGNLKPSILGTKACSTRTNCSYPSVGPCELFTYSLPLNLIRPSDSEMNSVIYNHTVNITLDVTNGANLTTSLQLIVTVQQKYPEQPMEDLAGFWSTGVTVGVAIGSGGLVLVVSVGILVCYKKRKNGSSTQGRRSATDSSPANLGAEGTDHMYDDLKDAKESFYETIHDRSSAAPTTENVYQNVVYQRNQDRATVHTPSETIYENTGGLRNK